MTLLMSLKRQNVKRKAPLKGAFELMWAKGLKYRTC